jgi:hypothetical protein
LSDVIIVYLRIFVSGFSAWMDDEVLSPRREGKNRRKKKGRNRENAKIGEGIADIGLGKVDKAGRLKGLYATWR